MKIGIIADDLTGGNGSGVKLSRQGLRALTLIHSASIPEDDYNVIVMDTDSRYASKQIARARILEAMAQLRQWGADWVAKRIDSTLRGNVGVEIDAMLDANPQAIAIMVPAYPDSGRIVSGGYMLVNGLPLEQTDVASDPVKPISHSYVADMLRQDSKYQVDSLFLNEIIKGTEALKISLEQKIEEGVRILCCDAVTNQDIETIAQVMKQLKNRYFIPVDPGPLTAYYTAAFLPKKQETKAPILALVGSATSITGRQLEYVKKNMETETILVNAEKLASYTSSWEEEVERAAAEAVQRLAPNNKEAIIITTQKPGFGKINLKDLSMKEGFGEEALAKRIADGLGSIFRKVINESTISNIGCFSSGGDVTASICAISRADGIELIEEVIPLAAYGKLVNGYFNGLPIVTKGGMVGDETTIYKSVKFLKKKIETKEGAILYAGTRNYSNSNG